MLLAVIILAFAPPLQGQNIKNMLLQATLNPTQTEQGVTVIISGRVFDPSGAFVPNAIISVQVINPQATTIHLAIAYSKQDGSFGDSFLIGSKFPGGNYTTYLVADKPGYDATRVTLVFSYSSPDFSLESTTTALSIRQGDSATITITVEPLRGFKQPVNLTALNLPPGVTAQFKPPSVNPRANVTVTFAVSETAALGNFTIPLLGVSSPSTHTISIQLIITRGPLQNYYELAVSVFAILVVVVLVVRRRTARARKLAAAEAMLRHGSADKGYVTTAGAIARLEELRARNEVDQATYEKLKKEYQRRLEKSK